MENTVSLNNKSSDKFSFNRNELKYIAIIAMLIDHVAWAFVPLNTALGTVMHIIGRLTAPCMCFFIAEGFHYTRNKTKYGIRLFIFALISWIPFHFFETGRLPFEFIDGRFSCDIIHQTQSMIYTLFLCFIALCFLESNINIILRIIAISAVCLLDMHADWHVSAILMTLVFYVFRNNKKKQVLYFSILAFGIGLYKVLKNIDYWYNTLFQFGVLLFVPFLIYYSGEKGSSNKFHKWFFYIFYPMHLIILGILKKVFLS